jgi:hypothetical protein
MLLRFVAHDQSPGSVVEAAVDDFEILDVETATEVAAPKFCTLKDKPRPDSLF